MVAALFAVPAAAQQTALAARAASARTDALASLAAIARPCPRLGARDVVGGAASPEQLAEAGAREAAYAAEGIATLDRAMADPAVTERGRRDLQALGGWSVAASLGNAALLRLAEAAQRPPAIPAGASHPLQALSQTEQSLAQAARRQSMPPEAAQAIASMGAALGRCRVSLGTELVQANAELIRADVDRARSTDELDRIADRYRLREYGGTFSVQLAQRRAQLIAAASVARPSAPPPPSGPPPAHLAAVRRSIAASRSGNSRAALAELSDDVVLSTPEGIFRGKADVARAVESQRARGRSGTIGEPVVSGGRIMTSGSVSGFPVATSYSVDGRNKIRRIDISLR